MWQVWDATPQSIRTLVYGFVIGNGAKVSGELSGMSIAQGYMLAIGAVAVVLITRAIVVHLRPPVLSRQEQAAIENDRQLLRYG